MLVETTKKLFTVGEYYKLAEVGILGPEDRVELIDGEIMRMSPIGVRHAGCVIATHRLFSAAFAGKADVSVQSPLRLNDYTEPEPDVVLLKHREDAYRGKRVDAEDALLVVEVSHTTLGYDQEIKLPRYAAAGIPEVWIENLADNELRVYRNPAGSSYATSLTLHNGDTVSVLAFPKTTFKVDDILGFEFTGEER